MRSIVSLMFFFAFTTVFGTSLDNPHGIAMSADNLMAAYKRNELDADSKYQGKRMSIGGVVQRVGKNDEGDPYVILEPNVLCRFSEAFYRRITQLQTGSTTGIVAVSSASSATRS